MLGNQQNTSYDYAVSISICIVVLSVLPITELVIGAKYIGTDTCDDRLVSPSVWLIVNGAVPLIFETLFMAFIWRVVKHGLDETLQLARIVLTLIRMVFNTIWAIIGAVSLWRDNQNCNPDELRIMMWIAVIIQLLNLHLAPIAVVFF